MRNSCSSTPCTTASAAPLCDARGSSAAGQQRPEPPHPGAAHCVPTEPCWHWAASCSPTRLRPPWSQQLGAFTQRAASPQAAASCELLTAQGPVALLPMTFHCWMLFCSFSWRISCFLSYSSSQPSPALLEHLLGSCLEHLLGSSSMPFHILSLLGGL